MIYAPILIPTLCRSEHFVRLIESLKHNLWAEYTELYVAIDFPPSEKYIDGWKEISNYLQNADLSVFKGVHIINRDKNYGAIQNGDELIRQVSREYDRFILIPDDSEVSPNFIEYMDRCLARYENDDDVIAVCGYTYPIKWKVSDGATCLKQNVNCSVWGTGYWRDKYNTVFAELKRGQILSEYPGVIKQRLYKNMIDAAIREYIEAACYKWCYGHEWLLNTSDIGLRAYLGVMQKYAISPVISKVRTYGFDGSGEYCQNVDGKTEKVHAYSYNYSLQPIDNALSFDLVEDMANVYIENRNLLNVFDSRTKSDMRKTKILIWLSENIGIWSAKIYCLLALPYDFSIRAYNKFIRK